MSSGNGEGKINKSARRNVFARDKLICQHCKRKCNPNAPKASPLEPTIDHVIPYSISHDNRQTNLITSCFSCNNEKGDNQDWTYSPAKVGLVHTITLPPHLMEVLNG